MICPGASLFSSDGDALFIPSVREGICFFVGSPPSVPRVRLLKFPLQTDNPHSATIATAGALILSTIPLSSGPSAL